MRNKPNTLEGVFFYAQERRKIMSFIDWVINHPPILPILFGIFILVGVSPTFYYLLKMIYSPCKNLQGRGYL
jgi:hypothetical protein